MGPGCNGGLWGLVVMEDYGARLLTLSDLCPKDLLEKAVKPLVDLIGSAQVMLVVSTECLLFRRVF